MRGKPHCIHTIDIRKAADSKTRSPAPRRIGATAGVAAVTATLAFFVNWSGTPPVSGALLPGGGVLSASGTV